MKKKPFLLCLCTLILGLFAVSCDDNADDPKYRSLPPEFEDMTFQMLESKDTVIKAGEKVLATCVQSKPGRLLNLTRYNWTADRKEVTHRFKKELQAGYDNENQNPTDTLTFPAPGIYNLTFNARYFTSGNYQIVSKIVSIDHGKITYKTPSFQFYDVQIEKKIVVK